MLGNGWKVFSGSANPKLTSEICDYLEMDEGKLEISQFADGEIFIRILENVRESDVYLVQPTSRPTNQNLMELLIMVDALKRASARRVTAVVPYFGYARQDRKTASRVPISAKLVANLMEAAGVQRVMTMDLHAGQIQGFFDIPVDNLFATPVLLEYIQSKNLENLCIVSPDAGGVERARAIGRRLSASLAIMDKRRDRANVAQVMHVIGEVEVKNVIMLDDIVDTAGTLVESAKALREQGAKSIIACVTHPVLSAPAMERLENSDIEELIVTNTIPIPEEQHTPKLKILSVARLLGEAIRRNHEGASVSSLFV